MKRKSKRNSKKVSRTNTRLQLPDLDQAKAAVHTFTIKKLIGQGWHLILKEGTHEFTLTAPSQPGKYRVECMVFCGEIHQDMSMTMTVVP